MANTTYTVFCAPTVLRVHHDVPLVPVWGYGLGYGSATTPGPLLEARVGNAVRIRFKNKLPGSIGVAKPDPALPFVTVQTGDSNPNGDREQNLLGSNGGAPQDLSKIPIGWTVAHLHGGHNRADYDGWPDNLTESGGVQTAVFDNTYDNADLGLNKVGAFLWYHDHAMNGTRFHVFSGLAGGYLLRDPREDELGLPTAAHEGEIVLVLQDRNLDVDQGKPRLLHKVTDKTAEFFGPLTLVNGLLWPRLQLQPDHVYRLRLLNGASARSYRLHLLSVSDNGDVTLHHDRLQVIGTESGLLWKSWQLSDNDTLTLSPGERFDVLLNLQGLPSGTQLYLVNSAPAPFGGGDSPDLDRLKTLIAAGDAANLNPYPQVLRVDVSDFASNWGAAPELYADIANATLNPSFRRLTHTLHQPQPAGQPEEFSIGDHEHKIILLAETTPPGHLYLQELVEDPNGEINLQLPGENAAKTYRVENWMAGDKASSTTRTSFYDRIPLRPKRGQWQLWKFVNTTGDTHPLHIHQSQFQPLGNGGGAVTATYDPLTRTGVIGPDPHTAPRQFEPHETRGWKDTIRIDPGNVVNVAIRFDLPGRYVYHCHVLEHEDTEMMRPFLVSMMAMPDGGGMAGM